MASDATEVAECRGNLENADRKAEIYISCKLGSYQSGNDAGLRHTTIDSLLSKYG